jgi:hypothetical protein
VLDDAVATQDTVTQLIGAIRRVRREVAGAAEVIAAHCTTHDYDDAGKPAIADRSDQVVRTDDEIVSLAVVDNGLGMCEGSGCGRDIDSAM